MPKSACRPERALPSVIGSLLLVAATALLPRLIAGCATPAATPGDEQDTTGAGEAGGSDADLPPLSGFPYGFAAGQRFVYSVSGDLTALVQPAGGQAGETGQPREGTLEIDVAGSGEQEGQLCLTYTADIAGQTVTGSVTAGQRGLADALSKANVPDPARVLLALVAGPCLGGYFGEATWEAGASWTFYSMECCYDFTYVFTVDGEKQIGDWTGYEGHCTKNGAPAFDFCVAPEVPLPLRMQAAGADYEITLVEFGQG